MKDDNGLEYDVETFVSYLIAHNAIGQLELIDKPIEVIKISLFDAENMFHELV